MVLTHFEKYLLTLYFTAGLIHRTVTDQAHGRAAGLQIVPEVIPVHTDLVQEVVNQIDHVPKHQNPTVQEVVLDLLVPINQQVQIDQVNPVDQDLLDQIDL